jgi:predicted alpha/beta hydrolase
MEQSTTTRVRARDGLMLDLRYLPPQGEARGVCVVGHAMMTNRRTLDVPYGRGFASTLRQAGWHTYLLDLRGHGASGRGRDWTYQDLVASDLPAVACALRGRHPGLPLVGAGHSLMGGALLAMQGQSERTERPRFDALVTICTNIWLPQLDADRWRLTQKWLLAQGFRVVASAVGRFPARLLRMGSEDVSRGFASDVARWTSSGRWDARDGSEYLASLAEVSVPVLALFASDDRVFCHPAVGAAFHRHLTRARLDMRVVGVADLDFAPSHMSLLLDARARPVWRDVATWLATCVPQGASLQAADCAPARVLQEQT